MPLKKLIKSTKPGVTGAFPTTRKEIKDIFITGIRIYELSLASRQMKLVDRARECGCSGLPQREYLAKCLSSAF